MGMASDGFCSKLLPNLMGEVTRDVGLCGKEVAGSSVSLLPEWAGGWGYSYVFHLCRPMRRFT